MDKERIIVKQADIMDAIFELARIEDVSAKMRGEHPGLVQDWLYVKRKELVKWFSYLFTEDHEKTISSRYPYYLFKGKTITIGVLPACVVGIWVSYSKHKITPGCLIIPAICLIRKDEEMTNVPDVQIVVRFELTMHELLNKL